MERRRVLVAIVVALVAVVTVRWTQSTEDIRNVVIGCHEEALVGVVVGAGPVGLAAAIDLEKRGFRVYLIEKRSENDFASRHQFLDLNPRSQEYLSELGLAAELRAKSCLDDGENGTQWASVSISTLQRLLLSMFTGTRCFSSHITEIRTVHGSKAEIHVNNSELCPSPMLPDVLIVADGVLHDGTAHKAGFDNPINTSYCQDFAVVTTLQSPHADAPCFSETKGSAIIDGVELEYRRLGWPGMSYLGLRRTDKTALVQNTIVSKAIALLLNEDSTGHPVNISVSFRESVVRMLGRTMVTVQGDSARRAHFFTGRGLNSGFEGLRIFFQYCKVTDVELALLEKINSESLMVSEEVFKSGCNHGSDRYWIVSEPQAAPPKLSQCSPVKSSAPRWVQLSGSNLHQNRSFNVWMNGICLDSDKFPYSSDQVGFLLPSDSPIGLIDIKVETTYGVSNSLSFEVVSFSGSDTAALVPVVTVIRTRGFAPAFLYVSGEHLCDMGSVVTKSVFVHHSGQSHYSEGNVCYDNGSMGIYLPPFPDGDVKITLETAYGKSNPWVYTVYSPSSPVLKEVSCHSEKTWIYLRGQNFTREMQARLESHLQRFVVDSVHVYNTEQAAFRPPEYFPQNFSLFLAPKGSDWPTKPYFVQCNGAH